MAEKEEQKTVTIPKWVWLILAGFGVLVVGLVWWNGRSPAPATSGNIMYLGWQGDEVINQLYLIDPDVGEPYQITDMPQGITHFSISPDGSQVAYSAVNEDDTIGIWIMNVDGTKQKKLWSCPDALCIRPVWAGDGRRLIVERRALSGSGDHPSAPQLWWLDAQTGESLLVFADDTQTGYGARLSPDDQWLSYIVPEAQEIQIAHLQTGESITAPSQTGEPAVWYPDGQALLISDIWFQHEAFSQHFFNIDLNSAALTNISGEDVETNDSLPVFSPDGEWVAFGRKKPRAPMGKQLWLMRPDGSDSRSLTEDSDMHHNNPSWSPDGNQIVVQGFLQTEPNSSPGLWLVDVESGDLEELASPGIQPVWLP